MWCRLVIEDNTVYELDDECANRKQGRRGYGGRGPYPAEKPCQTPKGNGK